MAKRFHSGSRSAKRQPAATPSSPNTPPLMPPVRLGVRQMKSLAKKPMMPVPRKTMAKRSEPNTLSALRPSCCSASVLSAK